MRSKLLSVLLLLLSISTVPAQNERREITPADLAKHTYYFDIENDKLTGGGARFLTEVLAKPQFILLGEYHGSARISEFTKVIIPVLHDAGCRTFGLEVGPVSVEILKELSKDPGKTVAELNAFNSKYYVKGPTRTFTPIPFFGDVEDAGFLSEASKRQWRLIGLDQEFTFGYLPLIDRMFRRLSGPDQKAIAKLYQAAKAQIEFLYSEDLKPNRDRAGGNDIFTRIQNSQDINEFLRQAEAGNAQNKTIADAIRITTEIYRKNATRKYYDTNSSRIAHMKENLRKGFAANKFDVRKEKMLLKMGGVHTGRGFSPLSLFEIGNTLSELAEASGNTSLHINFGSRFYVEKGKEIDALDDKAGFPYRFAALLQMAKKDQWTVIDLRPLREEVFYFRKYKLDEVVLEIFKNHDLYVIPKLEIDPTPNYSAN